MAESDNKAGKNCQMTAHPDLAATSLLFLNFSPEFPGTYACP